MKFYDGKTFEDKIIEWIKEYRGCYELKYLNNDNTILIDKDEKEYELIKKEMLSQAVKRDDDLFIKYYKYIKFENISLFISLLGFAFSTKFELQYLICVFLVATIYFTHQLIIDGKKYFELKKYHDFFEIKYDLEKEENKNILDVIEFDKFYQDPTGIGIHNLDNYSLWDINEIKKELKRRNEIK